MNRILTSIVLLSLSVSAFSACSRDDNPGKPTGTAGTGATDGATGGQGLGAGGEGNSGETSGGGSHPRGGSGAGGEGPAPGPSCSQVYAERPNGRQPIPTDEGGNITTDLLTADTVWLLEGRYYVGPGRTLTIEPGTLIEASSTPNAGSLFVQRDAKIYAVGTPDAPIVFTSTEHTLTDTPWGGLVLLGNAPIAPSLSDESAVPQRFYEGVTDPRAIYGGDDPEDDSGKVAYVRIEYGGDIIVANREINGLTFGGVGRGTEIHHVMVKGTADDCFEWFGGTVNAHHLICQDAGDDMFDADEGYQGYLQFLFGRLHTDGSSPDPNGFEWDGNQQNPSSAPKTLSAPHVSNATLCGLNGAGIATSYGAVLRRSLGEGTSVVNTIITGFDYGIDTRDNIGTLDAPIVSWTSSYFFDQLVRDTAAPSESTDNDFGFDEAAWLAGAEAGNVILDDAPEAFDCYASPPVLVGAELEGAAPPEGFEDTAAAYVGAGDVGSEDWAAGCWVSWE